MLEICVDRIESALAAQEGGADRLEICSGLALGGLTPSNSLVARCVRETSLQTMMMIRPDDGDFCYGADRIVSMRDDIEIAKELEVDGVVFGCLTLDGQIDLETCAELCELAGPLQTTFHRAFDMVPNPLESLHQLIELGFDRLLTSGLEPTAIQGAELIAQLQNGANGKIEILPGSGINHENVTKLINETGVHQIHASASRYQLGAKSQTSVSFGKGSKVTCATQVRQLVQAMGTSKLRTT